MSATQLIILLLIGLAAGFMSSMIGIGGGLVIVPALVFFYGMDQKLAQGTSLMVIALPVTAVGAYIYYKSGNADWRATLILAATFMVGGYFGGRLATSIDTNTIKKIFAVFLILIGLKSLFLDKPKPAPNPTQRTNPKSEFRIPKS